MTTIKLKNGSGAPTAGDLVQGEPALDLTNKRLYTEDSGGTVIEVGTNPGVDVTFADNRKAVFGAGSDLQIYHDGSNSYIKENGTGALNIHGQGNINLKNSAGDETLAVFTTNSGVTLYHDNSAKFATTSTGIDVTGTVTADGLTVAGAGVVGSFDRTDNNAIIELKRSGSVKGYIGADTGGDVLFFNGSAVQKLRIGSNGDISFYEDTGTTAKLFWDASAESLGINDTSPARKLSVNSGGTQIAAKFESTSTTSARIGLVDANTTGDNYVNVAASGDAMALYAGAAERVRITSGGNVGIGTTSPARTLEVNAGTLDVVALLTSTDTNSTLAFWDGTGGAAITNASGELALRVNGNSSDGSATTEAMRIDSNGNVGIGTSSPNAQLKLTGDIWTGAGTAASPGVKVGDGNTGFYYVGGNVLGVTTNGTERMRIDSSGNLLVGTTGAPRSSGTYSAKTRTHLGAQINEGYYSTWANPNGLVFTLATGSNGAATFLKLEGNQHNGYRSTYFRCANISGNWSVTACGVVTEGTTPTFTLANNNTANPTITLAFDTSYSGGFVIVNHAGYWSAA